MDIILDPYRIQSKSFPGICRSLAEKVEYKGTSPPASHPTLDSGISSDACQSLIKQGTDHSQEMDAASLFCALSTWTFIRYWFRCLAVWFSASRRGQLKCFPLPTPRSPQMPNISVTSVFLSYFCFPWAQRCVCVPTQKRGVFFLSVSV